MEHIIYDSESETSEYDFDDESANLDIELDNGYNTIICIADLGLWDGRKSGYKMLAGNKVNQVLSQAQGEYYKVVYDSETDDVKATDIHHDGTNYYIFRELKKNMDITILQDLIYYGKATQADINKFTKPIGKYVRKVYGWKKG
jgi:hypothetical protein